MQIRDLVINNEGRLSHSKIWTNIAYVVATWCILYESRQDTLDWSMLLVYLAVVGGSSIAIKLLDLKYGQQAPK